MRRFRFEYFRHFNIGDHKSSKNNIDDVLYLVINKPMTVNEIRKGLLSDHASYLCELDRQIIHQAIECEGRVKALMEDVTKLTETIEQLSKDNTDLREKVKRLTKEIGERDKKYFYENIHLRLSMVCPLQRLEMKSLFLKSPLKSPLKSLS